MPLLCNSMNNNHVDPSSYFQSQSMCMDMVTDQLETSYICMDVALYQQQKMIFRY